MTSPSIQDTPKQEYQVTPLELFFDLVFVFGVSQLSHHLLSDISWRGAAETLVMLLAVFAIWFSTSWSATIFPVDQPRMRRLILAVMLLGGGLILFLAAQGWYRLTILNIRSQLHLISGVAMLLVWLATLALPAYTALILVGASLTALAILDQKMPIDQLSREGV